MSSTWIRARFHNLELILNCEYPENKEVIAFADDLFLVALENDKEKLMRIVLEGFRVIARWIRIQGLKMDKEDEEVPQRIDTV